jgi:hypothetical protein
MRWSIVQQQSSSLNGSIDTLEADPILPITPTQQRTHARTRGRLGHALPSCSSCSSPCSCCSPRPALLLAPIMWRLPAIPPAVAPSSSCWRLLSRRGRGRGRLRLLLLGRRLLRRLALALLPAAAAARGSIGRARPAASPREERREGKHPCVMRLTC